MFASLALLLVPLLLLASDKKKDTGQVSTINFIVVKDDNGKPVRNAAVVLHPVGQSGKQSKGGFELKTDSEGKAATDGIPYGELRIQVIAPGFQTFGKDYSINQPTEDLTIRLKRPEGQYSIYEQHPGDNNVPAKDKQQ